MDKNWLGDTSLDKLRRLGGFSSKEGRAELASIVNDFREQGLSYDEIQSALRNLGLNIDNTTIRLISSR